MKHAEGRRCSGAALSVDRATVPDPYNEHDEFVLLPFIDDAVATHLQPAETFKFTFKG